MNKKIFRVLLFAAVCHVGFASCQQSAEDESSEPIVLTTHDEVREFVRQNLNEPIPESYEIPSYISSGLPLEQVYDTLAKRYPGFYGKEGQQYLEAVRNDPETYLKMSLESKSIRRYYDPNSKY